MINIGLLEDNSDHANLVERVINDSTQWKEPIKLERYASTLDFIVRLSSSEFDCVILDRNMPDVSGDLVVKWLKEHNQYATSIMMLTATENQKEKVRLLCEGANEYLTKPFDHTEFLIRLKRLVELSKLYKGYKNDEGKGLIYSNTPYAVHGVEFDDLNRSVLLEDQLVTLPQREYGLAKFLFNNVGVNLPRSEIFNAINLNPSPSSDRTLTLYIHRLRDKLELTMGNGWSIRPVYGFGYRLDKIEN